MGDFDDLCLIANTEKKQLYLITNRLKKLMYDSVLT